MDKLHVWTCSFYLQKKPHFFLVKDVHSPSTNAIYWLASCLRLEHRATRHHTADQRARREQEARLRSASSEEVRMNRHLRCHGLFERSK